QTAARYFVTRIHQSGVLQSSVLVLVTSCTVRHDTENIIDEGVGHARWHEYVLPKIVKVLLAGCAFDDASGNGVTVGAVAELRSRLKQKWLIGKHRKSVILVGIFFSVIDFVFFVVANPGCVREHFRGRDRHFFLREWGTVFLHGGIKV